MKNTVKRSIRAAVLATFAASATASADVLTELYFSQAAGFDPTTINFDPTGGLSFGVFVDPLTEPSDTNGGFNWRGQNFTGVPGSTTGLSEIAITSYDSDFSGSSFNGLFPGVVVQGSNVHASDTWIQNEWWIIDQLTQTNRELTGNFAVNPLWTIETTANFRVFENAVGDGLLAQDLDSRTGIEFFETLNVEAGCTVNTPSGSPFCSDIYRVSVATFAPLEPFIVDGFLYTVDFTLLPGPTFDDLGNLVPGGTLVCTSASDPGCAGAVVAAGQINVYTPEYNPGISNIFVLARWNAAPVQIPAPATLGLLGLGLVGLGLAVRRRKQAV